MSQNLIDLNQLREQYALEMKSIEHPDERATRLRRDEADATHQRWQRSALFAVGIGVALVVGGLSLWAALDPSFAPDTQKWAASLVTSMMTGIVGYLTGKNSK